MDERDAKRIEQQALRMLEIASHATTRAARADIEIAELRARLESAEQERAKLQAFKDWCHSYLDARGVPHHPPGTHGAEGCRIGDRLDWLLDDLAAARRGRDAYREYTVRQDRDLERVMGERDALRARLERAEVALRKALAICEVMYIGAGDTGTAGQFEAWGELVGYFRAALGAAGEEKDKGCQD